ncbi:MAG: ribosome hibernation-promoting factor, HPF/YfiA family [Patescibacteria group bacterium]|jgi:putative sigma-54 modulation protein
MKINLKSTRLEITEAIANYSQAKMDALDKYLGDLEVLNCDLELERVAGNQKKGNIFRVEANLEVPKKLLRVEKTEADLYKAIDKVRDHLEQAIKKHKGKNFNK